MRPFLPLFLVLCVLIGGSGCVSGGQFNRQERPEPFRAMSFNIRLNTPNDGEHAWPNRKSRVISTIRFNQADLVGMQEVLHDQLLDLSSALEGYQRVGVGRDDGKEAGEYSPIFYRSDRFELVESGTFWLSLTPDVPGSKDWDAAITRIATWARFKDRLTHRTLYHFNTHFDHRGTEAREKSAELLVDRVSDIAGDDPVIVTGDFNFTETAPGYQTLTADFNDAISVSEEPHHGPRGTFSGFEIGRPLENRIDFIFVKNDVQVRQHGILSDHWNGAYASDHLAVVATLDLD